MTKNVFQETLFLKMYMIKLTRIPLGPDGPWGPSLPWIEEQAMTEQTFF